MTSSKEKKKDIDPQETQDWIDSIQSLLANSGIKRAHFILDQLISVARTNGVKLARVDIVVGLIKVLCGENLRKIFN